MLRHGMTNRRIALQRGTSLDGVKFHLGNIRAKLGVHDRRALRRWDGARRPAVSDESTHLGALGQVSLAVTAIEPAVAFYRDVLGLPHLFTAGQLAFFDCDGVRLFLDALPEAQGSGNSVLYFRVGDIHAAQEALAAKGVTFEAAPHRIHTHEDGTEEWMTFFRDPDRNTLSLMSSVPPPR